MPIHQARTPPRPTRPLAGIAVAATTAAILVLTLRPNGDVPLGAACVLCGETWLADLIRNVILFLPFGLALASTGLTTRRIFAIAGVLSASIEVLQLTVVSGRHPSPVDLASNVAGALAGAVLWSTALRWRAGDRCAPMAGGLALLWWVQCFVTAWGLRPWAPDTTTYHGQWAHVFPGYVPLPARVLDARLHSMHVPDDSLADTPLAKRLIEDSSIVFSARTDGLAEADPLAQIVAITDGESHRFASLGLAGCSVQALASTNSERIGLETITIAADEACVAHGPSVTTTMRQDGRRLELEVRADGHEITSAALDLTPALGWALIAPVSASVAWQRPMTLGWIVLAFAFPIGLLVARGRRLTWALALTTLAVTLGGLLLPPLLLRTGRSTAPELLAAALATTLGLYIARRAH